MGRNEIEAVPQEAREDQLRTLVRDARVAAGLSVRELARRLNVSASFLSQFERGKSQASVSTLFSLANELGLSLDQLLGPEGGASGGSRKGRRDRNPPLDGASHRHVHFASGVTWELLVPPRGDGVEFLLTDYEPGADSDPDGGGQVHAGTDYGFILQGTLSVVAAGSTTAYSAGDAVVIPSGVPHRLMNLGRRRVRAVWFVLQDRH